MLVNTWSNRKQSFCKENQCFTNLSEVFEMYDTADLLDIYSSPKDLESKQQKLGDEIEGTFRNSLLIKRQQTIFQMKTGYLILN